MRPKIKPFPSYSVLTSGAKIWVLVILLGPFAAALLIKALEKSGSAKTLAIIEEIVSWGILALLIFLCYLILRWAFDRGGESRLYRLDLFFRKIMVRFSGDPGGQCMRWARATKDSRIAKVMTEEAARYGNTDGLYEWGHICKKERQEDSAGAAFLRAAQQGHPAAAWEMGEATRWGLYWIPANRAASRKWYELAARKGHVPSIRVLATALETGDGLDKDEEAAQRWQKRLQTALQDGSFETTGQFASMNTDLPSQAWEKQQARPFFEGIRFLLVFLDALASYVPMGWTGLRIPRFLTWISLAIFVLLFVTVMVLIFTTSIISIMFAIPGIYVLIRFGWMWYRSYRPNRALIKLEKRADAGESDAMYELGILYLNGSPYLPRDTAKAGHWLRQAAEAEHSLAMMQWGKLLAWGDGGHVATDPAKARQWLLRARDAGVEEADVHLRRMDAQ